jgi:hypothetical protein
LADGQYARIEVDILPGNPSNLPQRIPVVTAKSTRLWMRHPLAMSSSAAVSA